MMLIKCSKRFDMNFNYDYQTKYQFRNEEAYQFIPFSIFPLYAHSLTPRRASLTNAAQKHMSSTLLL
jgi:hypothetical protein